MLAGSHLGRVSATQSVSLVIALILISCTIVFSQGRNSITGSGSNKVQGRVIYPSGGVASAVRVRLENPNTTSIISVTDSEGMFYFSGLDAGQYTITVEAGDDFEPSIESLQIDPPVNDRSRLLGMSPRVFNLVVELRFKTSVKAKLGVINASLASVPKPALKEFKKALEAESKGDTKQAIDKLNEAVKLHPTFDEAYSELGALYLKTGQLDKAAPALKRATELDPKNTKARLNYGIVLLNQKDMNAAEKELREVIKVEEAAAVPHMYLGIALVGLNRYEEAEKEFLRAIELKSDEKTAQAHYYLAGIYWNYKRYSQAADELEKYLKLSPKIASAEKIRETIKELRSRMN